MRGHSSLGQVKSNQVKDQNDSYALTNNVFQASKINEIKDVISGFQL